MAIRLFAGSAELRRIYLRSLFLLRLEAPPLEKHCGSHEDVRKTGGKRVAVLAEMKRKSFTPTTDADVGG
jgi:hypothetical protein